MRYLASLFSFATFLVLSTESASMRKVDGGMEITADISELPRNLQGGFGGDYDQDQYEADGDDDASLLNRLIAFFLPHINTAFQNLVPDPFDPNLAGAYQLPSFDILGCEAAIGFNFDLGEIIGLSAMSIDRLQVVTGTEQVDAGCLETIWSAVFDMTILSTDMFSVQNLLGGFEASACGLTYKDDVTGGVNTYQPFMRGAVEISGDLLGSLATITIADIPNALEVGYESVEAFLDDVPVAWNLMIGDTTTELSKSMKGELIASVEPTVNPNVKEGMVGQQVSISYRDALAINSGFVKNGVKRQIRQAYADTASFFGGAAGFLGFGNGDE